MRPRSRGGPRPSYHRSITLLNREGAGNAGRRPRPWPASKKKAGGSHHRFGRITRHSLRDGFNGVLRALPGDRAFLPPSPRGSYPRNLASASGGQDHTTSPSVSASLVRRDRYVHRSPASRVVTIAIRPLHRGGMERDNHEILKNGIEIFFAQGLDGGISIESPCEFRFFAHGISAHDDGVLRDQSGQHCPSGESGAPRTALAFAVLIRLRCARLSRRLSASSTGRVARAQA